jgi:hypothetical protein
MGTKNNPGAFDCYSKALPDEPMFVLLARDPKAPQIIRKWVKRRTQLIAAGDAPASDIEMLTEAKKCAKDMEAWRKAHDGEWRQ